MIFETLEINEWGSTNIMKHKIAVYPGSFDPITLGHIDMLERVCDLFSEIHLVIANSSAKTSTLFTPAERKDLILQSCKHIPNLKIEIHSGLTVDYLKKIQAKFILRGLRNNSDYQYEQSMAQMNRDLYQEAESLLMYSRPDFSAVSSSLIKEVARLGGDVSRFVSPAVNSALQEKFKSLK